jgi:hypothetical protein
MEYYLSKSKLDCTKYLVLFKVLESSTNKSINTLFILMDFLVKIISGVMESMFKSRF